MSGHADTIRRIGSAWRRHADLSRQRFMEVERHEAEDLLDAADALVVKLVEQADRIAWLEGEVAGWRIKLAECEERSETRLR